MAASAVEAENTKIKKNCMRMINDVASGDIGEGIYDGLRAAQKKVNCFSFCVRDFSLIPNGVR
jgi:hypothetical protein